MTIWNYITIISVVLMTVLILVQTRGASLGAGIGGSAEVNTTRRGTDKTIFQMTVVLALLFALSLLFSLLS